MTNPFQELPKGLRRAYDAVQPALHLPKLPPEAPSNLRTAGETGGYVRLRGLKDTARQTLPAVAAGTAPQAPQAANIAVNTTAAKSPGLISRAGKAVGAAGRGLGTVAGGAAVVHDAYRTAEALDRGNNLQAGIRAAETGLSALSMVPGARLPAVALRMASGATFGDDGWINRRGSHFDLRNPSKADADWAVLANSIDPTKGRSLEDTQRAMREAVARGQTIEQPRQGLRGMAAALTQDLPEFLSKAGQYGGTRATEQEPQKAGATPEIPVPARPTQATPQQSTITRLLGPNTEQVVLTDGSTSNTDRISTTPGFFEGGENSAYARGERYVQSLRDMQNLRAQMMDRDKPTPGTAIIGPASGGNAALDLRRLADEQRNTPSAVVDRLRRGEINDRVAASLLDSYDRAQERLMKERVETRGQDMNMRAEQERAALRLASERGRKNSEENDGLGFKDQLALAKFQADLAKDQRDQRNADREFARNAENDEYGRRSAQQRDFMDRVDREFTEAGKDGKPFVNTARRNEFLRFADQSIADGIRRAEADLQANPSNSEARAQLQALLRNPYQVIDPRQYREIAALQEVDRLARTQGSHVASGTAEGKRIIGKTDSLIPFKEYYVTQDGSQIPTYAVDYQDGGYFSRAWKPKRTDLRTVMDVRARG